MMLTCIPFAPGVFALAASHGDTGFVPAHGASRFDLDYALARAEEEAVSAIRSLDPRAAERHREMASYYSIRALELLEMRHGDSDVIIMSPTVPGEVERRM